MHRAAILPCHQTVTEIRGREQSLRHQAPVPSQRIASLESWNRAVRVDPAARKTDEAFNKFLAREAGQISRSLALARHHVGRVA